MTKLTKMTKPEKSYEDLVRQIEDQITYDDDEPALAGSYSHNIIGTVLQIIDRDYGMEKAKQAMHDTGLEQLGWRIPE